MTVSVSLTNGKVIVLDNCIVRWLYISRCQFVKPYSHMMAAIISPLTVFTPLAHIVLAIIGQNMLTGSYDQFAHSLIEN